MSKHFYPAVFRQEDDGYSITFPDLEGCITEGDTIEESYEMAVDAIGLYLQPKEGVFVFPTASNPKNITLSNDEFVVLIEFDELEYLKKHDAKAVKKTLTLPSWLNTKAEEAGINFSQTLQEALKDRLDCR